MGSSAPPGKRSSTVAITCKWADSPPKPAKKPQRIVPQRRDAGYPIISAAFCIPRDSSSVPERGKENHFGRPSAISSPSADAEHTAKKTIKPDAMSAVNVELLTLSVSNAEGEIDFFAGFAGAFGSRESVCRVAIPRISVAMSTDRYRRSPFLRLCSIPLPTVEQKKTKDG